MVRISADLLSRLIRTHDALAAVVLVTLMLALVWLIWPYVRWSSFGGPLAAWCRARSQSVTRPSVTLERPAEVSPDEGTRPPEVAEQFRVERIHPDPPLTTNPLDEDNNPALPASGPAGWRRLLLRAKALSPSRLSGTGQGRFAVVLTASMLFGLFVWPTPGDLRKRPAGDHDPSEPADGPD
jgi:hypothetical protein